MSTPRPRAPTDQEVQEELIRLDAYRSQLNAMLQQHQYLTGSRGDHLRARQSLEGLETTGDQGELLIPLGGETFVRGMPVRSDSVLIGIGSGLVVEMERPKASEVLSERLDRIDKATQELEGQMGTLEERITVMSDRLDRLTRGGTSAGEGADVGGD